jgi:hypothetical protein
MLSGRYSHLTAAYLPNNEARQLPIKLFIIPRSTDTIQRRHTFSWFLLTLCPPSLPCRRRR